MSDYTTLIGAESIERGGRSMAGAAEEFGRHVSYLGEHFDCFLRRFEELVERMERAAGEAAPREEPARRPEDPSR